MATHEHTINDALAEVLSETRSLWRGKKIVKSENIGTIKGSAKQPDILVAENLVSPVVVETEVIPAVSLEVDAIQRLGQQLLPSGRDILSSIAVRMPLRLREFSGHDLRQEIANALDFEMALFTGENPQNFQRWPENGWLSGSVIDLSFLVQSASVPPVIIEHAADTLVAGVSEVSALLNEISDSHPGAIQKICQELCQQDGEQTRRMAVTILANAFVFHESLARGPGDLADVATLDELKGMGDGFTKSGVIDEWQKILIVNYWPIFDIARRILEVIPAGDAKLMIERLAKTADELIANRLMRSHDLTGAIFQRLIVDRKFLAAYYTTPAAAALLVGLVIRPEKTPANQSWAKAEHVTSLRVADLACGTGTLLSSVYRRISQLHEAAGGDTEKIHSAMMANVLVGCDVLPAAAHLTASMLAGTHPTVRYDQSSIFVVKYATKRPDGSVALGSLDLLDSQRPLEILEITAKAAEGMGQSEKELWLEIPHSSLDLVVMNPPFIRNTGHEGKKIGVPNPMFAAFGSTEELQRAMARSAERLLKGTCYHGNAGEASAFLALANRKLKDNGTLGLVMPLSLVSGDAWEAVRLLLREHYSGLIVISIAGAHDAELSFSADTDMGECLIIGKKIAKKNKRAIFVTLNERPSSLLAGACIANQLNKMMAGKLRKLEDGPLGGSLISLGNDIIGFAIDAALPIEGSWNLARVSDAALAQAAYQMADCGLIWLPGMAKSNAIPVPITMISKIGKIGPYHMDINGNTADGGIRDPFQIVALKSKAAPTYPVLWSHKAERERCLLFEADSEGIIRQADTVAEDKRVKNKADKIWETASYCHFNRDFRFNSQSTAMQFTERATIGGRAWPSIALSKQDEEKALVVWGNSTFGLLLHWWQINRQQSGRGSSGVSALESFKILDVTKLSPEKLAKAVSIFEVYKGSGLRPINEIEEDPIRHKIDEQLAIEILGFSTELVAPDGPLALLRKKLALEPSIAGGKAV